MGVGKMWAQHLFQCVGAQLNCLLGQQLLTLEDQQASVNPKWHLCIPLPFIFSARTCPFLFWPFTIRQDAIPMSNESRVLVIPIFEKFIMLVW